jgi:hypothetical protein
MKRVLFVASAVSYFREMAPVVWHFADQGWEVRVLLGSISPLTATVVAECVARGIRADIAPTNVSYGAEAAEPQDSAVSQSSPSVFPAEKPTSFSLPGWVRGALRWTRLGRFLRIPSDFVRMRRIRKFSDRYIAALKPDAVFQGAYHSVGQIDNGIARACEANHIPRYCLPNSGYVGGRIMPVGRRSHLDTGMASEGILVRYDWVNRLFARVFPDWTCTLRDGRQIFYWDPVFIFAAWLNGLFFERLWMKPAIDYQRVFVFSEYSAGLLRDDGYPMDKVLVAGQPLLDSVWERSADMAQQEALYRYLKLSPGTPFLLVNIEPSAEHSYCSWERHWDNFNAVMQAVAAHDMPVVLSLHPLCDAPRYEFAVEKYGIFICKDYKIHDLYPFCGISISFPCSTNLLAEIFDKPLIIFDFHGMTTADEDSTFVHALPGATLAYSGLELSASIADVRKKDGGNGAAVRPARLACETIFDTVAADLGESRLAATPPERGATARPAAAEITRRAS